MGTTDYGESDGRQIVGPCNQMTTTSGEMIDLCLSDDCTKINEQVLCAFDQPLSVVRTAFHFGDTTHPWYPRMHAFTHSCLVAPAPGNSRLIACLIACLQFPLPHPTFAKQRMRICSDLHSAVHRCCQRRDCDDTGSAEHRLHEDVRGWTRGIGVRIRRCDARRTPVCSIGAHSTSERETRRSYCLLGARSFVVSIVRSNPVAFPQPRR
jgi:hypothetical protein